VGARLSPGGLWLKLLLSLRVLVIILWAIFGRVRKIAKIDYKRHVCPFARKNSAPNGPIFMKFDIRIFFENLSRKLKRHQNLTTITVLYMKTYVHLW
jgi:hypothetical protein